MARLFFAAKPKNGGFMAGFNMYEEKRFDKRLIERHLDGGLEKAKITQEELDNDLDKLPDLADKCEAVTVKQPIMGGDDEVAENA